MSNSIVYGESVEFSGGVWVVRKLYTNRQERIVYSGPSQFEADKAFETAKLSRFLACKLLQEDLKRVNEDWGAMSRLAK